MFGYRNVEVLADDPTGHGRKQRAYVMRQIDETEAVIVRRIFTLYAGGKGFIAIAKQLNDEGIPAPRSSSFRKRSLDLGLLWFDAHADFNTPDSTVSGNIHGMPFAVTMGFGDPSLTAIGGFQPKFRPDRVVQIGGRDFEAREKDVIREAGITSD